MYDKLEEVAARYDELTAILSDPEICTYVLLRDKKKLFLYLSFEILLTNKAQKILFL